MKFQKGRLPGEIGSEDQPRKRTGKGIGPVPKKQRGPQQNAAAQAVEKKSKSSAENQPSNSLDGRSEHRPYEIEYDCSEPLGFYCVTEKGPRKYCKVM